MEFTKNAKGVEVLSDSGNTYQVHLQDGQPVFCTCPGARFRGAGRDCKHMRAVAGWLGEKSGKSKSEALSAKQIKSRVEEVFGATDAVALTPAQRKDGAPKTGPVTPTGAKREPQRAERYERQKLDYPHWMEPKLDGIRCLAFVSTDEVRFLSRSMKMVYNTGAIESDILRLGMNGVVLDGEAFAGSFGDSISVFKSSVSLRESEEAVFVVFDVLSVGEWERGTCKYIQAERRDLLEKVLSPKGTDKRGLMRTRDRAGHDLAHLRLAPRVWVTNPDEVERVANEFLEMGFEGGMLKDPRATYRTDRTSAWRKVKFVEDYDVKIVGVQAGKGKHDGRLGAIKFEWKGGVLEAGTGFTDDERDEMWALHQQGQLVGRIAEVGMQKRPGAGSSLFMVFRRLRPDKEEAND